MVKELFSSTILKAIRIVLFLMMTLCLPAFSGEDPRYHVPKAGSQEQMEILNAIRPEMNAAVKKKVKLIVPGNGKALAVAEGQALAMVEPADQKGQPIGGSAVAVLEKRAGKWKLLDFDYSEDALDQLKKKHPELPPILFEVIAVETNANDVP